MIRKASINDALEIAKVDGIIFEDSLGLEFIESDFRFNPFANYFVYEKDNKIVVLTPNGLRQIKKNK